MNNTVFGKTMKNIRKQSNIKLITTKTRRNYLVSGPNCRTTKKFPVNLLIKEMKRTQILMINLSN